METIFYIMHFAGFNIRLIFSKQKEANYKFAASLLKQLILNNYREFIKADQRALKQVDASVYFIWDNNSQVVMHPKTNKYYLNIFSQKGRQYYFSYQSSVFQFQTLLLLITQRLLSKGGGFLLHASAVKRKGKAEVFLGPSGAGKSTIVKLLSGEFTPLAWDILIIKKVGNAYFVYQTPFFEKEGGLPKKTTSSYPINRIFFIKKAKLAKINKINNLKLINKLFYSQLIFPTPQNKSYIVVHKFMKFFNNFYNLYFPKKGKQVKKLLG